MESLFLLVPIALVFVAIAVKILFWAIKSGQYDNLDTEAHRILFDEEPTAKRQEAPDPNRGEKKSDSETPDALSEPSSTPGEPRHD